MNSANKHIIKMANKIVSKENNKYDIKHVPDIKAQPWSRTLRDNILLDKFVKSPTSYQFLGQIDYITYIDMGAGKYIPAIMFKVLEFNNIIQSNHILCIYNKNLASLGEVWHNDWISFGAKIYKAKEPYSIYLYKLDNVTNSNLVSCSQRKLIHCYNPKIQVNNAKTIKDKSIKPHYVDYFIFSNRDQVPQNNKLRVGYAISKASTSYVKIQGNQLTFYKHLHNKNKIKLINTYSSWKNKQARKIQRSQARNDQNKSNSNSNYSNHKSSK